MTAYLISAFKDPQHLLHLVEALAEDADFFVHIDLNVDDAPFHELLEDKVTFVPRHRISWGGWSQVEYQAELIRAALLTGRSYSHLVCLSGQDYPLWSNARIRHFFDENAGRQILGGYNLTRGTSRAQRHKFTHIHPFRDLPISNRFVKNKLIVASRGLLSLIGVRRRPTVEIGGQMCDIYFGSDYWALSLDCARYVLQQLDNEPHIRRYFRTVYIPSELCIHTIVYNSPFAATAMLTGGEYPGLAALTPLHFIDYGKGIKVLTLEDKERLRASHKMFCRKVVSGISDELRLAIDEIRENKTL